MFVIRKTGSQVKLQGKRSVEKTLVDGQKGISIEVIMTHCMVQVVTIFRCKKSIRRGIDFTRIIHPRVVRTHPTGQSQPIGNIPFERSIECITLHIILEQLSIGNPIRIFHAINEFQTPKLFAVTQTSIITLVKLILTDIISSRKQIDADQRIVIDTLHQCIPRILLHISSTQIERQLFRQKHGGIPQGKIITVVDIVGNNAPRVYRSGLITLGTSGDANRVRFIKPGLEKIFGVITMGGGNQLLTPTH